jgi:hypothetical protein
MKKIIIPIATFIFGTIPFLASAIGGAPATQQTFCSNISLTTLGNIIEWASCTMIKLVVPFLFTLAMVGFIWGIIQFYLSPGNEEKRKNGKTFMLWGIIALFVMDKHLWG